MAQWNYDSKKTDIIIIHYPSLSLLKVAGKMIFLLNGIFDPSQGNSTGPRQLARESSLFTVPRDELRLFGRSVPESVIMSVGFGSVKRQKDYVLDPWQLETESESEVLLQFWSPILRSVFFCDHLICESILPFTDLYRKNGRVGCVDHFLIHRLSRTRWAS